MSVTCINHVDFYADGGSMPSCYLSAKRKARNEHTCDECGKIIMAGEMYLFESGRWDGSFLKFKTCENCQSLRASFFGVGFTYGCLWDDLLEHIYENGGNIGEIHITCLTPVAQAKVCDAIQKYWEDYPEIL